MYSLIHGIMVFVATAQASSGNLDWVPAIVQLATGGGFTALVWYLMIKYIPAIEARHQKERVEWLTYISQRDTAFEQMFKESMKVWMENKMELHTAIDRVNDVKDAVNNLASAIRVSGMEGRRHDNGHSSGHSFPDEL